MTLFLTSSPCLPGLDRAVLNPANGFVERLRAALPQRPRCLFICSDPDVPDKTDYYAKDMDDAFAGADMPFGSLQVLDGRNALQAAELVQKSQFIILAGGPVPAQNAFFHQIGLAQLLKGWEGVLMGVSAGTMNAASLVYAQPEYPGESVDPAYRRFLPGLGLTDCMILPHYQMLRDSWLDGKRLFEDITYPDSYGRTFYALPDGSYLYGTKHKMKWMGEVLCIRDGKLDRMKEEENL